MLARAYRGTLTGGYLASRVRVIERGLRGVSFEQFLDALPSTAIDLFDALQAGTRREWRSVA